MDWKIKLKMIGYYTGEQQNMYPEKRFVDEAAKLNDLLTQSFQLTFATFPVEVNEENANFYKSLSNKSVYIFKDSDKNLYAWFKEKKLARISHVIYDKEHILPIPTAFTSWFMLGESIPLRSDNKGQSKWKARKGIIFFSADDTKYTYDEGDLMIKKAGSDVLIFLKNNMYALYWPKKECIAEEDLKRLIIHKWTYLQEISASDLCSGEDCDGWDYSHCDMDRCREECEGCGGRRYKCNNSCRYNRYSSFVQVHSFKNVGDDLKDVNEIIDAILMPHSEHKELLKKNRKELEAYYKDCSSYPLSNRTLKKYCQKYKKMLKKENERSLEESDFVRVEITQNSKTLTYLVPKNSIKIEYSGCLTFWSSDYLNIDGYNRLEDDYISYSKVVKFVKGADAQTFRKHINERDFSLLRMNIIDGKIDYSFQ